MRLGSKEALRRTYIINTKKRWYNKNIYFTILIAKSDTIPQRLPEYRKRRG
jgi:hypothetical protein